MKNNLALLRRPWQNRRSMKRLLLSLLCLCASPAPGQDAPKSDAASTVPAALTPSPRKEPDNAKRHLSFNEISKKGEAKLVFLGDSITRRWETDGKEQWAKTWAPYQAANFGIGGDRTENILWRLQNGNYDGLKPKLTVLMIGTNNTGHRMDPAADTAAGIKAILEALRAKQPDMKILLLGVFPRGEKPTDPKRLRTNEINALLPPLADNNKIFFQDLGSVFLQPDGTLTKEIMPDFLHLSSKGYDLWTAAIAPKVKELMEK